MDNDYVFGLGLGWRVVVKTVYIEGKQTNKKTSLFINNDDDEDNGDGDHECSFVCIYIYAHAFSVAKCSMMSYDCTFCMF